MQTDRKTGMQTGQTDMTDRQAGRQADRQTGRQADRQADRQAGRQTGRQTDRQTDRQTGRQTDRQADRQTDRHEWLFDFSLNIYQIFQNKLGKKTTPQISKPWCMLFEQECQLTTTPIHPPPHPGNTQHFKLIPMTFL